MEVPKNIQSFFDGSAKRQLKQVESLLNSLRRLQVNVLMPDGTQLSGNLQLGGDSAVVYVRPNAGGAVGAVPGSPSATVPSSTAAGKTIADLKTQALTLCDGSTITVLLAP